jgi:hypothetical protein
MVDRSTWNAADWFAWATFGRDASYRNRVLTEGSRWYPSGRTLNDLHQGESHVETCFDRFVY